MENFTLDFSSHFFVSNSFHFLSLFFVFFFVLDFYNFQQMGLKTDDRVTWNFMIAIASIIPPYLFYIYTVFILISMQTIQHIAIYHWMYFLIHKTNRYNVIWLKYHGILFATLDTVKDLTNYLFIEFNVHGTILFEKK